MEKASPVLINLANPMFRDHSPDIFSPWPHPRLQNFSHCKKSCFGTKEAYWVESILNNKGTLANFFFGVQQGAEQGY